MSPPRVLLGLAVPLAATQLAIVALPLTDAVWVARLGSSALAGAGLGATLTSTAIVIAGSSLGALSSLIAQANAAGQHALVGTLERHARWVSLVLGTLLAAGALSAPAWLPLLGQRSDVVEHASAYLRAVAPGIPLALLSTTLRHLYAAARRARVLTIVWAIAVPLNAVLDPLLMYGAGPIPAMGVAGVGAATSLVYLAVFVGLEMYAQRFLPSAQWRGPLERAALGVLLRLGAPIMLVVGAEVGIFAAAAAVMGTLEEAALAAHQVALQPTQLLFMLPLGLAQAAAIAIADARGRRDGTLTRAYVRWSLILAVAVATPGALLLALVPELIADRYLALHLYAERALAIKLLQVVAAFQLFDAVQVVAAGVLRGFQDTQTAMRWSVLAYLGVAPAIATSIVLLTDLGALGVWLGLALALATAAIGLGAGVLRRSRHPQQNSPVVPSAP